MRVAIRDEHSVRKDLPEHYHDMQLDAEALGLFDGLVASTGVESVLCCDTMPEPGFDWLVHELVSCIRSSSHYSKVPEKIGNRILARTGETD